MKMKKRQVGSRSRSKLKAGFTFIDELIDPSLGRLVDLSENRSPL